MKLALNPGDVLKEQQGILDRHVEHLGDVLTPIGDLQGFAIVPFTFAHLAWHVDIREEVHLNLDLPIALASFAPAPADVEAESTGAVPVRLALLRASE